MPTTYSTVDAIAESRVRLARQQGALERLKLDEKEHRAVSRGTEVAA